jgi:hypothetical protein
MIVGFDVLWFGTVAPPDVVVTFTQAWIMPLPSAPSHGHGRATSQRSRGEESRTLHREGLGEIGVFNGEPHSANPGAT